MKIINKVLVFLFVNFLLFQNTFALKILEIMFNPSGSDTDREWLEIYNDGSEISDFTKYKFFEANVNHGISNVNNGDKKLLQNEYAAIVQDENKFKIDFPNYNGKIFLASFSLTNTGEALSLKDANGNVLDAVNYTNEASQITEGNSWQMLSGEKKCGAPTPGAENISSTCLSTNTENNTNSGTSTTTSAVFTPIYSQPRDVIEPLKIYAYAGENKIVLKNVEIDFLGKIFDNNKKEFVGGEFYWNFGEGSFSREKNNKKTFTNTGEYVIVLETKYQEVMDTDKIYIKVIEPEIDIKILNNNLFLKNNSLDEIEIGNFILKREDGFQKSFIIPKNTFVLPKREIIFASSTISFGENLQKVGIYFPNNLILKNTEITIGTTANTTATTTASTSKVITSKILKKAVVKKVIVDNNMVAPSTNIVVENKIILEKPKSFWQILKNKLKL